MKLLHLADLHLDSPFDGIGQQSPELQKQLIQSPYQAFAKGVEYAIQTAVDAVVIAGDIYDANRQTVYAQHFFVQQLQALDEAKIPVIIVHGNHDFIYSGQLTPNYPANVHVLDSETVDYVDLTLKTQETVRFYGFSYHHRWIKVNKAQEFPQNPHETDYVIGIYHGATEGENYAPFSIQELINKNYDYWALGHIHQPQVLHEQPLIQYVGTPQGRHRHEIGDLGGQLVTLRKGAPSQTAFISLATIVWHVQAIECDATWSGQDLVEELESVIYNYFQDGQATGQSQLLSIVLNGSEQLDDEVIEQVRKGEILEVVNARSINSDLFVRIIHLQLDFNFRDELFEYDEALHESYYQAIDNLRHGSHYEATMQDVFNHKIVRGWLNHLSMDDDLRAEIVQGAQDLMIQKIGFEDKEGKHEN